MATERELKVRLTLEGFRSVRRKLEQLGSRLETESQTEINVLFDYSDHRLQETGCALRLRSYAGTSLLTFKGRVEEDPLLKRRPEIQTEVTRPEETREILAQLGLRPQFLYSKQREIRTWAIKGAELEICLDQTPVGLFLEIEGREPEIREAARLLDLNLEDAVKESYVTLYARAGLGRVTHES